MAGASWLRHSDLAAAIAVVLVVAMMIIPVPPRFLDVLLAFNLTAAVVVLLVALYTRDALQFAAFPSLLLLLTLYRLSLNVSTTRLILLSGHPGDVITQFGQFVVGGNPAVGFVVFCILVVIQFLVITKGAERVAEVAARFTLDAMPGKQMAIDADLNAGLISEGEARARRKGIEQEADFYGAMDGASKFVKGDAIAGVIIVAVNLLGGFAVGVWQQGMSLAQAVAHFALLTVGDGLVTQIPALLISTATGIVVTRVASEGHLGHDVVSQILRHPRVLLIAGGVMAALALAPGLPALPFLAMAALMGGLGYSLYRAELAAPAAAAAAEAEAAEAEERQPESVMSLLQVDALEVELGYGLLPLADAGQGGDLMDRVVMIRRQIAQELGLVLPYIRVRDNMALRPQQYGIKLGGSEVGGGEILLDHYLAMDPGGGLSTPIDGVPTQEPAFGLPALWVPADARERAELAGYTVVDPPAVLATHLMEIIRRHAHELLGRQEVKALIDLVRQSHPALIEELTPRSLSLGEVQKVLQNLLREGVCIRNLVSIFEAMADCSAATRDTDQITEGVRQRIARAIVRQFGLGPGRARAVVLHPDLEEELAQALSEGQGRGAAVHPQTLRRLVEAIARWVSELVEEGLPPLLVTAPAVRPFLRRLTADALPRLIVLSYAEVGADLQIDPVGVVNAG